ncbi:MAG: fasciclin domain-containing protein [Candidatus Eisenbacteria bacterium]|nr:fasciclin domain-containing protein [Candidatus Eisenbacteria bacterium]
MRARSRLYGLVIAVAAIGFLVVLGGCQRKTPEPATKTPPREQAVDIVGVAAADGSFGTLVKAVGAAGLAETLKGPGPFTLFAPTDAAFAALPPGVLDDLLRPEKAEALRALLQYHVVPGTILATDVANIISTVTVSGRELRVSIEDTTVMINDARVTRTDIVALNGVVHAIDRVLTPPAR